MSNTWVMTVLIAFGKALLISLSILVGSCILRFLYRLWIRRMGCYDKDDLSESCKYEMELQSAQELNGRRPSRSPAHDTLSEIELPPSPGANTSCPPYSVHSLYPDKPLGDDLSDNCSGSWRQYVTPDGTDLTDTELTSMAGETTTMCSMLTTNDEPSERGSSPFPEAYTSHQSEVHCSANTEANHSSPVLEFQDYQSYVGVPAPTAMPVPPPVPAPTAMPVPPPVPAPRYPLPSQSRDRGTALFLSQYYKSLEQEQDGIRPHPPV